MASFATLEEFAERHGPIESSEENRVTAFLLDASELIRDEAEGSTVDWITEDTEAPHVIKAVCIAVAYRAWSNPDGASQITHADSSLSFPRGGSPDALYLTAAEKRAIHNAARTSSMTSVTLVSPYSGDEVVIDPDVGDL